MGHLFVDEGSEVSLCLGVQIVGRKAIDRRVETASALVAMRNGACFVSLSTHSRGFIHGKSTLRLEPPSPRTMLIAIAHQKRELVEEVVAVPRELAQLVEQRIMVTKVGDTLRTGSIAGLASCLKVGHGCAAITLPVDGGGPGVTLSIDRVSAAVHHGRVPRAPGGKCKRDGLRNCGLQQHASR